MPRITSLDGRTKTARAQKAAKAAIVRELGGRVTPLQNIIADAVAFDIARLEALNNTQDPDPKAVADLRRAVANGLRDIGMLRDTDWLRPLTLPADVADEQSEVA
jgi:hypothetical protein